MEALAKLLVLLLAIALFLQLMKHGANGPKWWLEAKFLGQPPKVLEQLPRRDPKPIIRVVPAHG